MSSEFASPAKVMIVAPGRLLNASVNWLAGLTSVWPPLVPIPILEPRAKLCILAAACLDCGWLGTQIMRLVGKAFGGRPKKARQARGHNLQIDSLPVGQFQLRLAAARHADHTCPRKRPAHRPFQSRVASDHALLGPLDYVSIAGCEHHLVRKLLLAGDQDRFLGQRTAVPNGVGHAMRAENRLFSGAVFLTSLYLRHSNSTHPSTNRPARKSA